MKQIKLFQIITEFFSSSKTLNTILFLFYSILLTFIISSQNLFFKNIIENGISKKDIVATRTITVVDVKRTEQHKKEIAQKIEPILVPAENDFIKDNLVALQTSVYKIRHNSKIKEDEKKDEISLLLDLSDQNKKKYVINYLIKSPDDVVQQDFDKSALSLENILKLGITERDYEQNNLNKLIQKGLLLNMPKSQSTVVTALLEQVIVPNLVIDEYATEEAKKNAQSLVQPYEVTFKRGEKIVFEGEPVTKLKRDALRKAGYNVLEINFAGFLGIFALVALGILGFLKYMKTFEKQYLDSSHITVASVLTLLFVIIAILLPSGISPYVLPFTAYIIIMAIFTNPRIAFMLSMVILAILGIALEYSVQVDVSFILINLIAMMSIAQIKFSKRFDLIRTGLEIGLVSLVAVFSIYMLEKCLVDVSNAVILRDCLIIFANGFISGVVALGLLPVLESAFKIITPYGLAELADHNQPLLKRLQFEAPGTYHHSLMVSNLCEAAAEAVGANPILARVGAFYHDIGKLKRPLFFVENQSYFGIENPHTKLNPRLSKMVITAHPKDGIELAKEYGLPPVIYNFILQHHGEGLAGYFYTQAVAEEGADNVKEDQFRYTGPKPQMKETAILMIADAVESAVRSLKNPSAEEIEAIIDKIIVERLNDGQLSDSPLTLRDVKTIATTFVRILRGMQHNRIKYHEDIVQELDKNKINMPKKVIDSELDEKIKQLENLDNKIDNKSENNES